VLYNSNWSRRQCSLVKYSQLAIDVSLFDLDCLTFVWGPLIVRRLKRVQRTSKFPWRVTTKSYSRKNVTEELFSLDIQSGRNHECEVRKVSKGTAICALCFPLDISRWKKNYPWNTHGTIQCTFWSFQQKQQRLTVEQHFKVLGGVFWFVCVVQLNPCPNGITDALNNDF